jgi:hypothetical protein
MNVRAINQDQFKEAKGLWAIAMTLKVGVFALGIVGILSSPSTYLPLAMLLLAVLSESFQLYSDYVKGVAEALLRKLDHCSSFGGQISVAEIRDLLTTIRKKNRKKYGEAVVDAYFDSAAELGPAKAMENLYESCWYSGKQALRMTQICGAAIGLVVVISIAFLVFSLGKPGAESQKIIKILSAGLMVLISLNMVKLVWTYYRMYRKCSKIEEAALRLSKLDIGEPEALRQWHEYQTARNSFPLLPDWLWNLMGDSLNDAWSSAKPSAPQNLRDQA